ncbi:MAG TPA: hypothetical protein VHO46_01225 [Bacteroidales bacterium]|nr:hypothetical protein [Bacteroidales bacterium]
MEKNGYFRKLYFKQWVIGLIRADIKEIIRTKNFNQDKMIWISPDSPERFYADPFIMKNRNGEVEILYEDFSIDEHYGNISVMTLDSNLKPVNRDVALDTGSHLSFPFIYRENNRVFVIPEAVRSGAVSCYEYNSNRRMLKKRADIIKMPLYDPTILNMNDKYWLFGSVFENRSEYKLHIFHSDNLMGPYLPLRGNPVRSGMNGIRAAGNFIEVDGSIFRPTQNCENEYGESITINRIKVLDEYYFSEEQYMTINISRKNLYENNIHTIHTLNFSDDLIVVDGIKWTFSPKEQWKNYKRNRRLLNRKEQIEP